MSSAFKTLFTDMVNASGDFSKLNKDLTKQNLRLFVKETHPYFLVSDSYFFVPAYFTKAAIEKFEKKFSNITVAGLKEKVILINNWSLELKKVDSAAVFTSYAGLEVRLIVNGFEPVIGESISPVRTPINLYRDDEFKTTIQALRHRAVTEACAKLTVAECTHTGKGDSVAQGIVTGTKDDWTFKQGNTDVVALSGAKKAVAAAGTAKVKGGAVAKRATKAAAKETKKATNAKSVSEKVMKFTPKKAAEKGKKSTVKTTSPAKPLQSATGTTDVMTMQSLKKFMSRQKKGALGKRSAGKKGGK